MSRTWALYDRNRTMLYILLGTYFVVFAPAIIVMIRPNAEFFSAMREFEEAKRVSSSTPDVAWLLGGCYASGWPTGFVVLFISLLVYESEFPYVPSHCSRTLTGPRSWSVCGYSVQALVCQIIRDPHRVPVSRVSRLYVPTSRSR